MKLAEAKLELAEYAEDFPDASHQEDGHKIACLAIAIAFPHLDEELNDLVYLHLRFHLNVLRRAQAETKRELVDQELGIAIADVVWVKRLGLCSHQPIPRVGDDVLYELKDLRGRRIRVPLDKMFVTTEHERNFYWSNQTWWSAVGSP